MPVLSSRKDFRVIEDLGPEDLEVGDKVIVKSPDKINDVLVNSYTLHERRIPLENGSDIYFNPRMYCFCGKEYVVEHMDHDGRVGLYDHSGMNTYVWTRQLLNKIEYLK